MTQHTVEKLAKAIRKQYPDFGKNCDSFEYIKNKIEIKDFIKKYNVGLRVNCGIIEINAYYCDKQYQILFYNNKIKVYKTIHFLKVPCEN